ncbi:MAG TPA: BolA family protein [Burkholderiales bacterium]|nr:BolA family protein [Burkholderiales bacterium]
MTTTDLIRERLASLTPDALEVFDESHEHAGHAGAKDGGGHYQLVIVSREFTGKPAVARHRLVYQALSDLMPKRIHALAIRAYTPEEFGTFSQGLNAEV